MAKSSTQNPTRLIWLTLLTSQIIYVVVGLTQSGAAGTSLSNERIFPIILGVVAIVTGGAAHFLWRRATGSSLPIHQAKRQTPQQAFIFFLLAWVLDESIAIYGLVLALLGLPASIWLAFSGGGAALLLLHRPVGPPA